MANNRMWLVVDESERRTFVAKGWGDGWSTYAGVAERLDRLLDGADVGGAAGGKSRLRLLFEHGNGHDNDPAWEYEVVKE